MKRRRVKITGIGPVTPAGIGREAFEKGIFASVSRIKAYTKLGEEYGPFVAGCVERFNIEHYVERSLAMKGAARHTQFAVAGAALAIKDAGVSVEELNRLACVVVAGSSLMDFGGIGKTIESFAEKPGRGGLARTVFTTNAACIPASIGQALGFDARALAIQTSCCAGLDAIGHAASLVATGEADVAICGGTEAPLFRTPLVELRASGLTPATAERPGSLDRPFDLWRTTGVVSEGAAMFVLEPESSPRPGYSFLSGYAFASDVRNEVCSGMADAMRQALADAALKVDQIDAISAWGPGHREIDAAEAHYLGDVFGSLLRGIPTLSIKGALGNPLGAAPAMQVAAAAIAHRAAVLPPTVNWEFPDPSCPLNLSAVARPILHHCTMVNAHGLSGVNSSLVLERC